MPGGNLLLNLPDGVSSPPNLLSAAAPRPRRGIDFTDQMVAWYWFFSTMWISLPASPRLCEGALALWRGRPPDDLADLPAAMTLRSRAGAGALLEFDRPDDAVASVTPC